VPLLAKAATLVTAIAVALGMWLGVSPEARDHGSTLPAPVAAGGPAALNATSDAEARQMRHVTLLLAREAAAGAGCEPSEPPARYAACAVPALRHLGIGGRTAATVLNPVIAGVPFGRCKGYLLGLQAGADSAGDQARWLLPQLYSGDRKAPQRQVAGQISLAAKMLRRVVHAAPAGVCAPVLDGPAV
jgi:hypothetical protein